MCVSWFFFLAISEEKGKKNIKKNEISKNILCDIETLKIRRNLNL